MYLNFGEGFDVLRGMIALQGPGPLTLALVPEPVVTVCPRSSDPLYVVTYYIKWVTTS